MINTMIENILIVYFFLGFILYDYINFNDRLISNLPIINIDIFIILKILLFFLLLINVLIKKDILKRILSEKKIVILMCICILIGPFFVDRIDICKGLIVDNDYSLLSINESLKDNLKLNINYVLNIIIFLLLSTHLSDKFFKKLGNVLIITFLINSIFSFFQFMYFSNIIPLNKVPVVYYFGNYNINHRSSGLFEKSFFFGTFLIFVLSYVLYYGSKCITRKNYITYISLITLVFINIFMTGNRSTIIIAAFIYFINIFIEKNKNTIRINIILILIIIGIMIVVISFNETLRNRIFQPLNMKENYSLSYRTTALKLNMYDFFVENPRNIWFGLGFNTIFSTDLNIITLLFRFGIIYLISYIILFIKSISRLYINLSELNKFILLSLIGLFIQNILVSGIGIINENLCFLLISYSISNYRYIRREKI